MIKPPNIESTSQLLEGVGASAWFHIKKINNKTYEIKRYSEHGDLDCRGLFSIDMQDFKIKYEYKFTYVSHCSECRIIQNNKIYLFRKIENN